MVRVLLLLGLAILIAAPGRAQSPALAISYERECSAVAAPVLSRDGERLYACGAIFRTGDGQFLGRAPFELIAALPGDALLTRDPAFGGLQLSARQARLSSQKGDWSKRPRSPRTALV